MKFLATPPVPAPQVIALSETWTRSTTTLSVSLGRAYLCTRRLLICDRLFYVSVSAAV